MSPTQLEFSPLLAAGFATSAYVVALAFAQVMLKFPLFRGALTTGASRYGALDGLRGLLALGVLVHHSFTAYVYATQGRWDWSHSAVLNQLGQTTVALFFMITGFLFTVKATQTRIDWAQLYASRMARLLPLYAALVMVLFGLVMHLSGWQLNETPGRLVQELFQWLTFVVFGRPDINAYPMTWTIIAGVNWSLKFEVCFYLVGIPALHLFAKQVPRHRAVFVSLPVLVTLLLYRHVGHFEGGNSLFAAHFLGGIVAAHMLAHPALTSAISSTPFKALAVAAVGVLATSTQAYELWPTVATIVVFLSVLGGASLFGLLYSRAAVWLGDVSYGIYLLHGMALWFVLHAVITPQRLGDISLGMYWTHVMSVAMAVTWLAGISYATMERPIMQQQSRRRRAMAEAPPPVVSDPDSVIEQPS